MGSRKLFAVLHHNQPPPKKKRRYSSSDEDSSALSDKLDAINYKLTKILEVTPQCKVPLGLSTQLCDSFRCNICKTTPLRPPAIFARCCKRILGCMECTDKWYKGEEGMIKDCPLCRGDRGYTDTSKILGLDDLIFTVRDLLHPETRDESDTD